MDPLVGISTGQSVLERIASAIPGFSGYRDRERRREADGIAREHLARRLEGARRELDGLADKASRVGALDAINDIETARKKLEALAARIRYADRGYSGFFDAVKIDEAMLERVYRFDLSLLAGVEEAEQAAQAASAAAGGIGPALQLLITRLGALDSALAERDEILSGVR
jgi:hypothetical protein